MIFRKLSIISFLCAQTELFSIFVYLLTYIFLRNILFIFQFFILFCFFRNWNGMDIPKSHLLITQILRNFKGDGFILFYFFELFLLNFISLFCWTFFWTFFLKLLLNLFWWTFLLNFLLNFFLINFFWTLFWSTFFELYFDELFFEPFFEPFFQFFLNFWKPSKEKTTELNRLRKRIDEVFSNLSREISSGKLDLQHFECDPTLDEISNKKLAICVIGQSYEAKIRVVNDIFALKNGNVLEPTSPRRRKTLPPKLYRRRSSNPDATFFNAGDSGLGKSGIDTTAEDVFDISGLFGKGE